MMIETNPVRSNRLIVLLPDCLANHASLAHQVYGMAHRDQRQVIYLTLVDNEADIPLVGCHLETLKTLTATNSLSVQSTFTATKHWLRTIQNLYCPGDEVVCQKEQVVRNGLFGTLPIGDYLQSKLDIPVTYISGYYHPDKQQLYQWLRELIAWVGFLAILAFFTWFEVQLNPITSEFAEKALLSILVVIEISLIWIWNTVTKIH